MTRRQKINELIKENRKNGSTCKGANIMYWISMFKLCM